MTSSSGRRSDSASPKFSDDDIELLKRRQVRLALILDGALPTTDEILSGFPPRHDDLQSDVMAYVDEWRRKRANDELVPTELMIAVEAARQSADYENLLALRDHAKVTAETSFDARKLAVRADVWLGLCGDRDAAARTVLEAIQSTRRTRMSGVTSVHALAFAIGVSTTSGDGHYEAGDMSKNVRFGLKMLSSLSSIIGPVAEMTVEETGLSALLKRQREAQREDEEERAVGQLEALIETGVFEDEDDATLGGDGIIVVPKMGDGVGGQKEVRKTWKSFAGVALPVIRRGDVAAHKRALVALYPHASDVIDIMLRDLAPRDTVWFRPTLIVGAPGSGKTSLLRAIADQVGLPCELNSLAGSTDSAAMGTSAQWSTVRESVPLQLIKRSKKASVALIWDEVDKASSSRNNGSIIDALLPLLEPDQARRYRDLALEVEVDLSAVTHFATANDLDSVPQPLRDRFRILTMPEPTWAHLGTLTRQIVDRISKERGIDPRFFGDLAEDEMELIKEAWPGGSIRKLTRIVTTILDGRDMAMARC